MRVPCAGYYGFAFPFTATAVLFDPCYDPASAASGWAEASSVASGDPDVVAWYVGAPPSGSPPDASLDVTLDTWVADYGRTQVDYVHSGASASMALDVRSSRGRLETSVVETEGDLNPGDALSVTVPADTAFHDLLVVTLRESAGLSSSEIILSSSPLAATGDVSVVEVTRDAVPPVSAFVLDPAAISAELPLPDGWSCAGRAANYARLSGFASTPSGSVSLTLAGEYVGALTLPELSAEVQAILAAADLSPYFRAEVASVEGGFAAFRHGPAGQVDWGTLHDAAPPGGQSCRALAASSF